MAQTSGTRSAHTIRIDTQLMEDARVYALRQKKSFSSLVAEALRKLLPKAKP